MTTSTHTHEELATKKDVDERFDFVDERFDRVEARLDRVEDRLDQVEKTLVHINGTIASIMNVLMNLNERVTALEENQKTMIQMLERIENSTNRQIGF